MPFDLASFRLRYKEFANIPDNYIELVADDAECYLKTCDTKCGRLMRNLMVAHLLYLSQNTADGSMNGVLTNATIDKVTVGLKTLDTKDSWVFWLQQSDYGKELLAIIKRNNPVSWYNGSNSASELSAFRRNGGIYANNGRATRWR